MQQGSETMGHVPGSVSVRGSHTPSKYSWAPNIAWTMRSFWAGRGRCAGQPGRGAGQDPSTGDVAASIDVAGMLRILSIMRIVRTIPPSRIAAGCPRVRAMLRVWPLLRSGTTSCPPGGSWFCQASGMSQAHGDDDAVVVCVLLADVAIPGDHVYVAVLAPGAQ